MPLCTRRRRSATQAQPTGVIPEARVLDDCVLANASAVAANSSEPRQLRGTRHYKDHIIHHYKESHRLPLRTLQCVWQRAQHGQHFDAPWLRHAAAAATASDTYWDRVQPGLRQLRAPAASILLPPWHCIT